MLLPVVLVPLASRLDFSMALNQAQPIHALDYKLSPSTFDTYMIIDFASGIFGLVTTYVDGHAADPK